MTTIRESYSAAACDEIEAAQKAETDHTSAKCTGKTGLKAEGVSGLTTVKNIEPVVKIGWKAPGKTNKIYMATFADHIPADGVAPFSCTTQAGFVCTMNAKNMKNMMPPCKESFVLECAVSKYNSDTGKCKFIITGGMQNAVNIYDMTKAPGDDHCMKSVGQFVDPLPALEGASHNGYIAGLEFTEKGAKVLSASGDSYVKLWDMESRSLVTTFKGHHKDATGIACHPSDPNLFVSTSTDKTCRMWDKRCGAVRRWTAKYSTNCCTFAGEHGTLVAAGCDNACWEVWDSASNTQVARGKVKKGRCESMASCKSGRVLYMGWDNQEAGFLLMADTFQPTNQKKLEGHNDMVKGLSLDPEGAGLISASFDGTVKLWAAPAAA